MKYKLRLGDYVRAEGFMFLVLCRWHGNRSHKINKDAELLALESGIYEVKKL